MAGYTRNPQTVPDDSPGGSTTRQAVADQNNVAVDDLYLAMNAHSNNEEGRSHADIDQTLNSIETVDALSYMQASIGTIMSRLPDYIGSSLSLLELGRFEKSRDAYPTLWAEIEAHPEVLKTDDEWLAIEALSEFGAVEFYSSGDGATTFRTPTDGTEELDRRNFIYTGNPLTYKTPAEPDVVQQVATNSQNITTNSQNITTNSQNITTNTQSITTISESLVALEVEFASTDKDYIEIVDPYAVVGAGNPWAREYSDGTVRGGNDLGIYVRFPNGLAECTTYNTRTISVAVANGAIFKSGKIAGTPYPLVFVNIADVGCTITSEPGITAWPVFGEKYNDSLVHAPVITLKRAVSFTTGAYTLTYSAKGEWK